MIISETLTEVLTTQLESAIDWLEKQPLDYQVAQLYTAVIDIESTFTWLLNEETEEITNDDLHRLIVDLSQSDYKNVFLALAQENYDRSNPVHLADAEESYYFVLNVFNRYTVKY